MSAAVNVTGSPLTKNATPLTKEGAAIATLPSATLKAKLEITNLHFFIITFPI